MKFSPLELRQQRFRKTWRGYDHGEVTTYLTEIADDYEQILREHDRAKQELAKLEAILTEHREHERNLRNTLLTAQRLSDEIRENAQQEARTILREAELRAEALLEKAQTRLQEIQHEITDLKLKRRDVQATLETAISTLQHALEIQRGQEEREDKIVQMRRRSPDEAREPVAAGAAQIGLEREAR